MRRLAIVLLALAACTAGAQTRELPPAPGEPRDFQLPPRETLGLANGLSLTFVDYGTVPTVTVLAVVRTGNIDDGESTWLADVTAEMMKEGTATRSAPAIAEAAAGMGGSLNVGAGAEQATVGISVLSEYAVDAVELVADVLRNPAFPESELPRVIANFERSVAVARADPGSLADEALGRLVYGDHPFGRALPREGQLAGYDIAKVRGFYERNFGARRTHVYVAGRYDRAALEAALRDAFGDWQPGPPPTELPAKPSTAARLELVDSPGAPQSSLRMAVPVPDPSSPVYFQATLMNSLLGGTFASRITSNIREQKGYTYSPYSTISSRFRDAYWAEVADVTTNVTGASLTEIVHEIDSLRSVPPSVEELRGIQNYLAGTFVLQNSSRAGIIGILQMVDLHGLGDDYLTEFVRRVHAVTPADVQAAARRYLLRPAVVVVGPA